MYIPNPNNLTPTTIGEHRFFNMLHWKLFVMMGYDWTSVDCTNYGLSILVYGNSFKLNNILDFLDINNIKYSIEYSTNKWYYKIKISKAKKYLKIIDDLYENFYLNTTNI
jgi:hypothetical protein